MLRVLILAGGRGERLWPKSRLGMPKQFQALFGEETLLQATWRRARLLTEAQGIYAVVPEDQRALLLSQLPEIRAENVVVEPEGRDTLPCLVLAFARLAAEGDGPVMVFPADHFIGNPELLAEHLLARPSLEAAEDAILLVGVRPTRPETGYGYIEVDGELVDGCPRPVLRFHEKPDLEMASRYVANGRFLWNAGMLLSRPSVFLSEVRRHASFYLAAAEGGEAFRRLPRLSVDHGLLEKTRRCKVLPLPLQWDDVGSWESLPRLLPPDEGGNVKVGRVTFIDSGNSLFVAGNRPIVAFGVRDVLLVDDGDVLLVADRSRARDMKGLLAKLRDRGEEAVVAGGETRAIAVPAVDQVVEKPWGKEFWWAHTEQYAAKLLYVKAGHSLSLQYHERKEETLWFLEGRGLLTLGDEVRTFQAGMVVHVPPGTIHRITALSDVLVVEVSTPELSDVVRIEDRYGRTEHPA